MVAPLIRATNYAIVNATLVTMAPFASRPALSAHLDESDLGIVGHGTIVVERGRIAAAGPHDACATALDDVRRRDGASFEEIDAARALVLPGFIDAHTHALFAGDRIGDFESLASGEPPGLGIAHTVKQTRACDLDGLIDIGARHLDLMAAHGTTTAEIKTGYALNADGEALMLQAMRALDERDDLPHVAATFCGAHALPPEFDSHDAFVEELVARILPRVADLGIAQFADAYCETGAFTPAQSRRFLEPCAARGMRLRIHAEEFDRSGGAALAAELGCVSADHLNFIDDTDAQRLAKSGTIAVLCPATAAYLGLKRWAPARQLIDRGVPVALATDLNPGTSPCYSLQAAAFLARRHYRLSAAEAIAAVTVNAARSLGIATKAGALLPGYRADFAILEDPDFRAFGYYYGTNMIRNVAIGV